MNGKICRVKKQDICGNGACCQLSLQPVTSNGLRLYWLHVYNLWKNHIQLLVECNRSSGRHVLRSSLAPGSPLTAKPSGSRVVVPGVSMVSCSCDRCLPRLCWLSLRIRVHARFRIRVILRKGDYRNGISPHVVVSRYCILAEIPGVARESR
jgi:hypothetical protein